MKAKGLELSINFLNQKNMSINKLGHEPKVAEKLGHEPKSFDKCGQEEAPLSDQRLSALVALIQDDDMPTFPGHKAKKKTKRGRRGNRK